MTNQTNNTSTNFINTKEKISHSNKWNFCLLQKSDKFIKKNQIKDFYFTHMFTDLLKISKNV